MYKRTLQTEEIDMIVIPVGDFNIFSQTVSLNNREKLGYTFEIDEQATNVLIQDLYRMQKLREITGDDGARMDW